VCNVKTTVAVLPAVVFRLGDEVPAGLFTQQASAAGQRAKARHFTRCADRGRRSNRRETEAVLTAR